jgi:diphthine-ammonia ligase
MSKYLGRYAEKTYVISTVDSLSSSIFGESNLPPITPIPCRAISSATSDNWDLAFCIVGESEVL